MPRTETITIGPKMFPVLIWLSTQKSVVLDVSAGYRSACGLLQVTLGQRLRFMERQAAFAPPLNICTYSAPKPKHRSTFALRLNILLVSPLDPRSYGVSSFHLLSILQPFSASLRPIPKRAEMSPTYQKRRTSWWTPQHCTFTGGCWICTGLARRGR